MRQLLTSWRCAHTIVREQVRFLAQRNATKPKSPREVPRRYPPSPSRIRAGRPRIFPEPALKTKINLRIQPSDWVQLPQSPPLPHHNSLADCEAANIHVGAGIVPQFPARINAFRIRLSPYKNRLTEVRQAVFRFDKSGFGTATFCRRQAPTRWCSEYPQSSFPAPYLL